MPFCRHPSPAKVLGDAGRTSQGNLEPQQKGHLCFTCPFVGMGNEQQPNFCHGWRKAVEHQGEKSPEEQGLGSPQRPEEPESRRWHLSTSLSQGKHPAAPEVLSETLWPSWHSESWELFSTPALGRGELSASQVSQGSSSPGMNPCGSQSPSASPAARVAIASSPCGETEAQ